MNEKITVRKLIMALMEYNMDAEIQMVANNKRIETWELTYGSSEGVTKETAENVSFNVNGTSEKTN